jgi:hypothetical protein
LQHQCSLLHLLVAFHSFVATPILLYDACLILPRTVEPQPCCIDAVLLAAHCQLLVNDPTMLFLLLIAYFLVLMLLQVLLA